MSTPEQIAAGLSDRAKSALLMFAESTLPGGMLIVEPGDEPVVDELCRAGCVSDIRAAGYRFIDERPLGLSVRRILSEQSQ